MKLIQINPRKWPRELGSLAGDEGAALFAVAIALPFLAGRLNKIARDPDAFEQTRIADWFSVSIEAAVNADLTPTFETIVPIDVPSIMPGYGVLPAVVGVENQTGAWDAIGQTRIVRLADDTTAREEITSYEAPHRFDYNVSEWSGAMKFLARRAKSEWRFSRLRTNQTRVEWRYTFVPRSAWTAWLLLATVQLLWRGAMKQALRECVRQAENST